MWGPTLSCRRSDNRIAIIMLHSLPHLAPAIGCRHGGPMPDLDLKKQVKQVPRDSRGCFRRGWHRAAALAYKIGHPCRLAASEAP